MENKIEQTYDPEVDDDTNGEENWEDEIYND